MMHEKFLYRRLPDVNSFRTIVYDWSLCVNTNAALLKVVQPQLGLSNQDVVRCIQFVFVLED